MNDQEFLMWIHARLTEVHGENPHVDYMHKLRAVIMTTREDKFSHNVYTSDNLEELRRAMTKQNEAAPTRSVGVHRLVMRYRQWLVRRHAKRLYHRLWNANDIVMVERHGAIVKQQNKPYWKELEACADVITAAAIATKRAFDPDE